MASDRPHTFTIIADGIGVHAERAFTIRAAPGGLNTVVVSYETQVGWLPRIGRAFLASRLRASNQTMFEDLARAVGNRSITEATSVAA